MSDNGRNKQTTMGDNSHIGGPSEDRSCRIRKGQIDWVVGLERASDFKAWSFKFKMGAATYLSREVYPNEEERRYAYINALIRASSLGKFQELCDHVELLDASGVRCEGLLERLEKRYLPAMDVERKRVSSSYLSFTRGKASLLESFTALQKVLLECHKYGYDPGTETERTKLEQLVLPEDWPIYRLYLERERAKGDKQSELECTRNAVEALGRDQEDKRKNSNQSSGTPPFVGSTQRGKEPRRKGHPERKGKSESSGKQKGQPCERCGKHCPATRGEPKEKCYAFGQECNKCGKKGHYGSVCRSGSKSAAFSKADCSAKQT